MSARKIVIATAAIMLASPIAYAADNGTTLAGPAQGTKSDGSSSMNHSSSSDGAMPSRSMERSGGTAGAATGTMSGGSTATGGNVGGPAGRN